MNIDRILNNMHGKNTECFWVFSRALYYLDLLRENEKKFKHNKTLLLQETKRFICKTEFIINKINKELNNDKS